jgi:phosphatidylglycerophosphatase A
VAWWFGLSLAGIPAQIAAILLLTIVGIWSAGSAERDLGHDAHPIVIDEVVGQWIPLLFTNKSISWVVVAFFLFRILDVIKPFGIRDSQKLPGGYGVVIDDLLAGLLAGVIIMIGQKII